MHFTNCDLLGDKCATSTSPSLQPPNVDIFGFQNRTVISVPVNQGICGLHSTPACFYTPFVKYSRNDPEELHSRLQMCKSLRQHIKEFSPFVWVEQIIMWRIHSSHVLCLWHALVRHHPVLKSIFSGENASSFLFCVLHLLDLRKEPSDNFRLDLHSSEFTYQVMSILFI